ncbi:hypothetical protein SBV1_590040 [Verrucomicrobia bacterium]|nr:hypothetical protein SBV1_590040 [Verrucomicrobiota bacterium]
MEANQLGRLQDILSAARLIAQYVNEVAETEFASDTEKQDAVIPESRSSGKPPST